MHMCTVVISDPQGPCNVYECDALLIEVAASSGDKGESIWQAHYGRLAQWVEFQAG